MALMSESVRPWAAPEDDSDVYREELTVKAFNLASVVSSRELRCAVD